MIQWGEKLYYVESQSTCYDISNLLCMNKVSESNSSIKCQSMFESTQLTLVNEIIQNCMKLKTFTNDFLNEFF